MELLKNKSRTFERGIKPCPKSQGNTTSYQDISTVSASGQKGYLKKVRDKKAVLIWISLFLILIFLHSRHILNSDEGLILEGAWNLFHQKTLYLDFFANRVPGAYYFTFWVWKIFGANYAVAKFASLLFVFFSAIGIYKICQTISQSRANYLVPLLFIISSASWPIINHSTLSLFFIVWATYFFLKGLSSRTAFNFILCGLLTGLTVIFLQHKGLALLAAFLSFSALVAFIKKDSPLIKLNAYLFISSLLPVLLLFFVWPAQILFDNLILYNLFHYIEKNKVGLGLLVFFSSFFLSFIWILKKEKLAKVWLLICLQLFLFLSIIPRPDIYHIALAIFPLYALFPLALKRIKLFHKSAVFGFSALSGLAILIILKPVVLSLFMYPPFYTLEKSNTILFIKEQCPGEYIYAGPFLPGIYFETRKLNPTPYPVLITGIQTNEQFKEAVRSLKTFQPLCAVLNYAIVEKFNYDKNNPVDNFIKNNYLIVYEENNETVYKLKSAKTNEQ